MAHQPWGLASLAAAALLAVVAPRPTLAKRHKPPLCPGGTFFLTAPLTVGGDTTPLDTIVIQGREVGLPGTCPTEPGMATLGTQMTHVTALVLKARAHLGRSKATPPAHAEVAQSLATITTQAQAAQAALSLQDNRDARTRVADCIEAISDAVNGALDAYTRLK